MAYSNGVRLLDSDWLKRKIFKSMIARDIYTGANITFIRQFMNKKQKEFAEMLEIQASQIKFWENFKQSNINMPPDVRIKLQKKMMLYWKSGN
jgi:hypothetical protein